MEADTATKDKIHMLLVRTPGSSRAQLARELEMDPSTVDYHLRVMRRASRVEAAPVGREVCWFATRSAFCPLLMRAVPALRRPGVAAVARELEDFAQTVPALAARSATDIHQVRWAAGVLVGCGIAERSSGRLLRLAPGASTCVDKALAGERCGEWGKCAPSRKWERENPTSSP